MLRHAVSRRACAAAARSLHIARPMSTSANTSLSARAAAADGAGNASAATIASAARRHDGLVDVVWRDGRASAFDAVWLRENCPSNRHPSGQRLFSVADLLVPAVGAGARRRERRPRPSAPSRASSPASP